MSDEPKYYTVQEVAAILKVHINTIYKMLDNGDLKGVKVGTDWRIPSDSLPRPEIKSIVS